MIRTGGSGQAWMQMWSSTVQVPRLFFLTLLVTLPLLYVFNALIGSRLGLLSVVRLLIAMLGVTLVVLSSLGPIVVLFSVSTTSYPFIKLLNVAMATVAGLLRLAFLLRTLHRLVIVQAAVGQSSRHEHESPNPDRSNQSEAEDPESLGVLKELDSEEGADVPKVHSALDPVGPSTHQKAKAVFRIWGPVFALEGA